MAKRRLSLEAEVWRRVLELGKTADALMSGNGGRAVGLELGRADGQHVTIEADTDEPRRFLTVYRGPFSGCVGFSSDLPERAALIMLLNRGFTIARTNAQDAAGDGSIRRLGGSDGR